MVSLEYSKYTKTAVTPPKPPPIVVEMTQRVTTWQVPQLASVTQLTIECPASSAQCQNP